MSIDYISIVLVVVVLSILYLYYDIFFTASSTNSVIPAGTPTGTATISTLTTVFTPDNTTVTKVAVPTYQVLYTNAPQSEYSITTVITPKAAGQCVIGIKPGSGFTYAALKNYSITMTSLVAATGTASTAVYGPVVLPLTNDASGFQISFLANSAFAHTLMLKLVTSTA